MQATLEVTKANPSNPELLISDGMVGVDRVLFYVRKSTKPLHRLLECVWVTGQSRVLLLYSDNVDLCLLVRSDPELCTAAHVHLD